jgi:ferritin-like metal-binding protein YciE
MKSKIKTLNDALTFLLQRLCFTEIRLIEEFGSCSNQVTSLALKREIDNYTSSSKDKVLKLERAFNYLLEEPMTRTNDVINDLIKETKEVLAATASTHLKDVLSIGCVQNINAYKISGYRHAYMFAVELELDTVSDLLQQILDWEIETSKIFSRLSIEEFNRSQHSPSN